MSEKQDKDLFPKQFVEKRPGFVIKSGTRDAAGRQIDYAMFTDRGQGFEYTHEGNKHDVTAKASLETCGKFSGKDEVAKGIYAMGGNIVIDAKDGDIILKGLNIRIEAQDGSGEVTITAPKQIQERAPVVNIKGSKVNMVGTNSAIVAAQTTDIRGNIAENSSSGTEDQQGGIMSQIFAFITGGLSGLFE